MALFGETVSELEREFAIGLKPLVESLLELEGRLKPLADLASEQGSSAARLHYGSHGEIVDFEDFARTASLMNGSLIDASIGRTDQVPIVMIESRKLHSGGRDRLIALRHRTQTP